MVVIFRELTVVQMVKTNNTDNWTKVGVGMGHKKVTKKMPKKLNK